MQKNSDLQGAPLKDYLGVWRVDEIVQGSNGISGCWANIGKHLALYSRKDKVVLAFTEQGFCTESYDPFWFKYCKKTHLLFGLGRDGVVKIAIGFIDNQLTFRFSHANGDGFTQSGDWKATRGDN